MCAEEEWVTLQDKQAQERAAAAQAEADEAAAAAAAAAETAAQQAAAQVLPPCFGVAPALAHCIAGLEAQRACTVAPVMFGKPLLNNVLMFDYVQSQKGSDCWDLWVNRLRTFTGATVSQALRAYRETTRAATHRQGILPNGWQECGGKMSYATTIMLHQTVTYVLRNAGRCPVRLFLLPGGACPPAWVGSRHKATQRAARNAIRGRHGPPK